MKVEDPFVNMYSYPLSLQRFTPSAGDPLSQNLRLASSSQRTERRSGQRNPCWWAFVLFWAREKLHQEDSGIETGKVGVEPTRFQDAGDEEGVGPEDSDFLSA